MRRREIFLAVGAALLLALGGCTQPPTLAQVAPTLTPVPPGQARIYIYRDLEPYETLSDTPVSFNGQVVGDSRIGSVFYRDVTPGSYYISVRSGGLYPNQFQTVTVGAGQVLYVKIESLKAWSEPDDMDLVDMDTFVVAVMDPAVAQREMQGLWYNAS